MAKEPTTRAETAVNQTISERALATVAAPNAITPDMLMTGVLEIDGFKIVLGQSVTRPTMQQRDNQINVFRIDGAIYQGEDLNEKQKRSAKRKGTEAKKVSDMAPARLMPVFNYMSKSDELCIVNAVLEESLIERYPDSTNGVPDYVGKSFAMGSIKRPDKRYREYSIREIEVTSTGAKTVDKPIIDQDAAS